MQKVTTSGAKLPGLFKRNNVFVFRKAIPNALRPILGRIEHVESLRTECPEEAIRRYFLARDSLAHTLNEAKLGRHPNESAPDLECLKSTADGLGIRYKPIEALLAQFDPTNPMQSLQEFLARAETWQRMGRPDDVRYDALFGSVPDEVSFDSLLMNYEEFTRADRVRLNSREADKKLAPKRAAVRKLAGSMIGSNADVVTKADALRFRSTLLDAVEGGSILASTANKQLGHLRVVYDAAIQTGLFQNPNPFLNLQMSEEAHRRNSFSVPFVRDHLLPGLEGLSLECCALVWAAIDTGSHFKELCGLAERDIHLSGPIPFIRVEENEHRKLKNAGRRRDIPLVGLALQAFQNFPLGFPTYRRSGGSEAASANCNKYFRKNGLIEPAMYRHGYDRPQTTYSFRHMFQDRMRAALIQDSIQQQLMGHKAPGMSQHYGMGYDLCSLRSEMDKIASHFLQGEIMLASLPEMIDGE